MDEEGLKNFEENSRLGLKRSVKAYLVMKDDDNTTIICEAYCETTDERVFLCRQYTDVRVVPCWQTVGLRSWA